MPTLTVTHEAPLELIRQFPRLAVDLARAMIGLQLPDDLEAELGPTSLNAVVPAEFTADAVVVVKDKATGNPELIIVVEPQGREDKDKVYAWPAYLALVRDAVQCPSAILLVVCPDPREAEKCRKVISMGHPGWDLYPIVIDPAHHPDEEGAGPYLLLFLACLPALDLTAPGNAERILAAIRDTGAPRAARKRIGTIILKRANEAAREILEKLMETDEWKSDFIESYVNIGIEQGREEVREEAREQVEQAREEVAATKAQDVLKVIDARELKPTKKQRAQVTAAAGLDKLNLWFDRALTAKTAAAIFEEENEAAS